MPSIIALSQIGHADASSDALVGLLRNTGRTAREAREATATDAATTNALAAALASGALTGVEADVLLRRVLPAIPPSFRSIGDGLALAEGTARRIYQRAVAKLAVAVRRLIGDKTA